MEVPQAVCYNLKRDLEVRLSIRHTISAAFYHRCVSITALHFGPSMTAFPPFADGNIAPHGPAILLNAVTAAFASVPFALHNTLLSM